MSPRPSTLRAAVRRSVPPRYRALATGWPTLVALARLPPLERASAARFPLTVAGRSSPLRRPTIVYGEELQRAKEANVRRVAALLDGLVFTRGAVFSWHRQVGPPTRWRGFHRGPELHGDRLDAGEGGGLCQVANLLFLLALHAGWTIVERHRHALDLFPDAGRDVPFGAGATVFFPHKDLKLVNPFAIDMRLAVAVSDTHVTGTVAAERALPFRCEVVEKDHRVEHTAEGVFRHNVLLRRWYASGTEVDELIATHHSRVLYAVAPPRGG